MCKRSVAVIGILLLLAVTLFCSFTYDEQNRGKTEDGSVELLLAGDLMCQYQQQEHALINGSYDFNSEFDYIRDILQSADLSIGNLETNISSSQPLGLEQKRKYDQPYLNAPASYLDALKNAGFDLLVNANNHNADTGIAGLMETLKYQEERGFYHTGMFTGKEKNRFLIVEEKGIKIGFASYATYYNRSISDFTTEEQNRHLNRYSEEKMRRDVQTMRKSGAEYIIVYFHCGKEYSLEPSERQMQYAQEIAEAGANYIVCSHSHTVQPYTRLIAENGRTVPVVYAAGNFVSSMLKRKCNYGMLLSLTLEKEKGEVVLKEEGYYPSLQLKRNPDTGKMYQVVFCTESGMEKIQSSQLKQDMQAAREEIIEIVGSEIVPFK